LEIDSRAREVPRQTEGVRRYSDIHYKHQDIEGEEDRQIQFNDRFLEKNNTEEE